MYTLGVYVFGYRIAVCVYSSIPDGKRYLLGHEKPKLSLSGRKNPLRANFGHLKATEIRQDIILQTDFF